MYHIDLFWGFGITAWKVAASFYYTVTLECMLGK